MTVHKKGHRTLSCDVEFVHDMPPVEWEGTARILSDMSGQEQNILYRTPSYFLGRITAGAVLVATREGSIIGSVTVHQLSRSVCEIGSAWVLAQYRGFGIYSSLKDAAVEIAQTRGSAVISTAKVCANQSSAGLSSSISRGLVPVPFQVLAEVDRLAYEACCCCGNNKNVLHCVERDKTCVLTMKMF